MEILKREAKQSWSSSKVILQIGNKEVATIHHSGGNGLDEKQAVAIAKQFTEAWNAFINQNETTKPMSKIEEILLNKEAFLTEYDQMWISDSMKEYAEWYAEQCIDSLFGGRCVIESNRITHTSADRTFKISTDLPKHK